MIRVRSLLLMLALCCASCSDDPRPHAEKKVREIGVKRLRQDAAWLYKENFAARTVDFIPLRSNRWPDSFKSLAPVRVGLYLDGITIALGAQTSGEVGIYLVPLSMDQEPKNTASATFQRIADGVYWYSFSG